MAHLSIAFPLTSITGQVQLLCKGISYFTFFHLTTDQHLLKFCQHVSSMWKLYLMVSGILQPGK